MTIDLHQKREPLTAQDSDLSESRFSNCKLHNSTFTDVNLSQAAFRDTDFSRALFLDVNLKDASIADANLSGMKINGMLVSELLATRRLMNKPSVVVFAKNLAKLALFYQRMLSMSVANEENDHVLLDAADFQLVIHALPAHIAQQIGLTEPPTLRVESAFKVCLPVTDIGEARAKAAAAGGAVKPAVDEWQSFNLRVCDGYDPEGNVFQIRASIAGG